MMTVGQKIAELRKLNHYSQEELGRKMNVSRQTISKWETDLSLPDIEHIIELSQIFQVTLNELLQVNEDKIINHDELQALFNQMLVIQDNYENERQTRKKQKRVIFICILVFIIGLCCAIALLFTKMKHINQQIGNLSSNLSESMNDLGTAIKKSDSLLSDFSYQIEEINLKENKVKLFLKVALKDTSNDTHVQFQIVTSDAQNYILETNNENSGFVYDGYIPICNISQFNVVIKNGNQVQNQLIEDFKMDIKDISQPVHEVTIHYLMKERDPSYDKGYKIEGVTFEHNSEYEKENLELRISELRNQQQIMNDENISIVYDDALLIKKIDYSISYKDEIIKEGTLVNVKKEKDYQGTVDINIDQIQNGKEMKVVGKVYDSEGKKYTIYNHAKASTIGLICMDTIDCVEELNENNTID